MISHPSVAGAAVLAGLMVAGGTYAARHDIGLGAGLPVSAAARATLQRELQVGHEAHPALHVLTWRPPHVPKIHVHHRPPQVAVVAAPVVVAAAAPAPVATATTAPVTRTSPAGGDGGGDGGGDD